VDIRTNHSEAMDLAEKATAARVRGELTLYRKLLLQALDKEQQAALLAVSERAPEPTRSILLKSASHLAIDCGELRLAEQLIGHALAGEPPPELADELRSMFEQVGFSRHLAVHGVQLENTDLQIVLAGNVIAPGMAASDEFVDRVDTMQRLIYRTSESDRAMEYRHRGEPKPSIENPLRLFVSVPRAASFAVSLRVASDKQQGEFGFAESVQVIDHLMERLEMFEQEDSQSLQKAIPNKEYLDNFVSLAARLAPDGQRVRLVGLTAMREGKEKRVEMKRPAAGVTKGPAVVTDEVRKIHGRVFFYNSKDEDNPIIKLMAEDGTEWRLKADDDRLQKAVVYAAGKKRVLVKGVQAGKLTLIVDEFTVPKDQGFKKKVKFVVRPLRRKRDSRA